MLSSVKTQEELRNELQRLFEADLLDEAEALLETLEPLSDEDWDKMLAEAPLDDEPATESERSGFAEIRRLLAAEAGQRGDFKKLSGADEWRLRVGDWRVSVLLAGKTVYINEVNNRRDAY